MQDLSDLNTASEDLAAVSELIKRNRPSYQDAAVQLLIRANTTVVRIQNKGAAAYARYLERHGLQGAPGEVDPADPGESAESDESKPPGAPEED